MMFILIMPKNGNHRRECVCVCAREKESVQKKRTANRNGEIE